MSNVVLRSGVAEEPQFLCCKLCGRRRVFEPVLPYVNQSASFATDHSCGELDGDGPCACGPTAAGTRPCTGSAADLAADLAADRADAGEVLGDRDAAQQDRLAAVEARAKAAEDRERTALVGLDTRSVIGQAQGILMARLNISPDKAFRLLVSESKRRNIKLHSIAAEHVAKYHD